MESKPRFVTYCRVSTAAQGSSGLSLEAQLQAVKTYVFLRGGEIIDDFKEVESGKDDHRPELEKAIKKCRKTNATLLVSKLDRLSRNVEFLITIKNSAVELAAADMPDANTFTFTVMAALAQYEREYMSQRTKAALSESQRRRKAIWAEAQANYYPPPVRLLGGLASNPPSIAKWQKLGTQANQKRAKDAAELIREDIEFLVGQNLSLRTICLKLDSDGIATPYGKKWSLQCLKNFITRLGIERANVRKS